MTADKVYTGVPKETFVVNTFTPAYTITPNMPCENKMGFDVATIDMTVPDGTEMKQGQKF